MSTGRSTVVSRPSFTTDPSVDDAEGSARRRTEHQRSNRIVQAAGEGDGSQIEGHEIRCHHQAQALRW
jgi:hypothetical protein